MIRRETLRRLPLVAPFAALLPLWAVALALGYWGPRIVGPIVGMVLVGLGGLGGQALVSIIEWSRREAEQEEAEQLRAEILDCWEHLPPDARVDLLKRMLQ